MAIFYNQAALIHNGQQTNSNTTTGEVRDALTFTKTAIYSEYDKGGTVSYLLSFTNESGDTLSDVTVSDNLGEYEYGTVALFPLEYIDGSLLYFVDGVPASGAAATVDDGRLTVAGITLPSGSTAQIIYTARANEFAPLAAGSEITNTATLEGECIPELTSAATVTVNERTELTITKFVTPDSIPANGELTYTFVIQNTGNAPAVATDDVIVTDTFDPPLDISLVTFNGAELDEVTGYTYDASSGAFATLPGQITVPAATFTTSAGGAVIITPGVSVLTVTGTV